MYLYLPLQKAGPSVVGLCVLAGAMHGACSPKQNVEWGFGF